MSNKKHKKGMLILDEIVLRTSISVNSRSLTYTGLEDFGGELPNKGNEKADLDLVIMWQSQSDQKLHSTSSSFCLKMPSKGPL